MTKDEATALAALINRSVRRYRAAPFDIASDTWVILDDLEHDINPPPIGDVGRYLALIEGLLGVAKVAPELRQVLEQYYSQQHPSARSGSPSASGHARRTVTSIAAVKPAISQQ